MVTSVVSLEKKIGWREDGGKDGEGRGGEGGKGGGAEKKQEQGGKFLVLTAATSTQQR